MDLLSLLIALAVSLSTPCPTEDSDGCYWDADARSNGQGSSFIALPAADNDDAVVIYLD